MSFFTSEELIWMRDEVEKTLPDTCNILSLSATPDGQGGFTETWGTATASVACRVDAVITSNSDTVVGEGERVYTRLIVTVPHDTTITEENRIEANGYTLDVDSVDNPKSAQACQRVYAYALAEQP